MAHKTLIGGTAYEITGGRTLINGTSYAIDSGKTLVSSTGYRIEFTETWQKWSVGAKQSSNAKYGILDYVYSDSSRYTFRFYGYRSVSYSSSSNSISVSSPVYCIFTRSGTSASWGSPSNNMWGARLYFKSDYGKYAGKVYLSKDTPLTSGTMMGGISSEYISEPPYSEQHEFQLSINGYEITPGPVSLIETITAAPGTYPNNGYKDGYWYIKI